MNMKQNVYQNKIIEAKNIDDLEFLVNDYLNSNNCEVEELVEIKYEFADKRWYAFIVYKI